MPAGITIEISSSRRSTPLPLHFSHTSFGTCPAPRQTSQALVLEITPRNDLLVSCIFPCPLQCLQVSIPEPALAPEPLQVRQLEVLVIKIFLLIPKIESEKEICSSVEISRPPRASFLPSPMPPVKKSLKMSFKLPKSKFALPSWKPPEKFLKSKPPNPPC